MANIIWLSPEEPLCLDCGSIGITECYCEQCEHCETFTNDVECREDIKDEPNMCEDCYVEFVNNNFSCEYCDLIDETVENRGDNLFCDECYGELIANPPMSQKLKNQLEFLGGE